MAILSMAPDNPSMIRRSAWTLLALVLSGCTVNGYHQLAFVKATSPLYV